MNTKVKRSRYPLSANTVPIYFMMIEREPMKFRYALKLAWLSFSLSAFGFDESLRQSSSIEISNPKSSSFKKSLSSLSGFSYPINEYTIVLRVCTVFLFIPPFFLISLDNKSLIMIGSISILCCSASFGILFAFYSFLLVYSACSSISSV